MTTTAEDQREARAALARAMSARDCSYVIHYADEGFGVPAPRVTSIAARNLGTGQTTSFGLIEEAQQGGIDLATATRAAIDQVEKRMLDRFFAFVGQRQGYYWLHWNMRDSVFGFSALETRHKFLGGKPIAIPDTHKLDISVLMFRLFGDQYAAGPSRLKNLAIKNGITITGFMEGQEQAAALAGGDYKSVHRSTLRKVDVLFTVADKARAGRLKTSAPMLDLLGVSFRGAISVAKDHPLVVTIGFLATIVGFVAAVAQLAGG